MCVCYLVYLFRAQELGAFLLSVFVFVFCKLLTEACRTRRDAGDVDIFIVAAFVVRCCLFAFHVFLIGNSAHCIWPARQTVSQAARQPGNSPQLAGALAAVAVAIVGISPIRSGVVFHFIPCHFQPVTD